GVADLLDAVTAGLPEAGPAAEDARGTRLALIGRPNVGKSSLLNRLLGAERTIVAPEPGTTRDAIDTPLIVAGRPYVLIDTAGIRRRGKVREPLERHGAVRALGTLARADLVLAVLDAAEGMTDQDARLVGRAWEAGRGVVLLANKWDLVPSARRDRASFRDALVAAHPAFAGLPLLCVSAETGEGLGDLFPLVARLERAYEAVLPTPALNRALEAAVAATSPPSPGGRALRFFYATQTARRPPAVTVFGSAPALDKSGGRDPSAPGRCPMILRFALRSVLPGLLLYTLCAPPPTRANPAPGPLRFIAPTPVAGSVVTSTTVSVRLDAECTVDPSTLAVSLNGTSIPASQFQPFSACQNGRMSSQTASVGLPLPNGTITSGPTSLTARTTASFSGSGTGDGFRWNFDGGAQPATGASVSATFNAAGTFTIRLRATKTEQLQASAMDNGNVVTGQLAFAAGDPTPDQRQVVVAMPPDLDFANYESSHVHPLAVSGSQLYAVNTPDDRLAIFTIGAGGSLTFAGD